MTQPLQTTVHRDAGHAVVTARGPIYRDTIEPLHRTLSELLAADPPRIVLDLSGVDVCDSSGLNLLASSHTTATSRGGWLRLTGLQPLVERVVSITNLTRLLSIHPSVDDAVTGNGTAQH